MSDPAVELPSPSSRRWIGYRPPPVSIEVERGQILLFCEAVGETNAVHLDDESARDAGYRGLLAPPTFAFCLWCLASGASRPFALYTMMGHSLGALLHARQRFRYHREICAGDVIEFKSTVADVYEKKGGSLLFIDVTTTAERANEGCIVEFGSTFVVRQR